MPRIEAQLKELDSAYLKTRFLLKRGPNFISLITRIKASLSKCRLTRYVTEIIVENSDWYAPELVENENEAINLDHMIDPRSPPLLVELSITNK